MQCRSLITLTKTKSGIIPQIPCGQCLACRLNRRDRWAARVLLEYRASSNGQFLTLTLDENGLVTFRRVGARRMYKTFLENLRRSENRYGNPMPIRSFGVLEWGETLGRPHLHIALFNAKKHYLTRVKKKSTLLERFQLPYHIEPWPHGHVHVSELNETSARYLCKYITKFNMVSSDLPDPISFYPRNPCLGLNGLELLIEEHSRSPLRNRLFEVPVTLDGRKWDLDQTMRQHCLDLCKSMGVRTVLEHHELQAKKQLRRMQDELDTNWQRTDYLLKQEQLKEMAYQRNLEKDQRRFDNAVKRALNLGQVHQENLDNGNPPYGGLLPESM